MLPFENALRRLTCRRAQALSPNKKKLFRTFGKFVLQRERERLCALRLSALEAKEQLPVPAGATGALSPPPPSPPRGGAGCSLS